MSNCKFCGHEFVAGESTIHVCLNRTDLHKFYITKLEFKQKAIEKQLKMITKLERKIKKLKK